MQLRPGIRLILAAVTLAVAALSTLSAAAGAIPEERAAAVAANAAAAQQPDEWLTRPVDDATFETYLEFFEYDAGLSLDLQVSGAETVEDVRDEHISFLSTPGVRVTANLYRPEAASAEPQPAIILVHGGGASGKDGAGVRATSRLLARAGWTVLAIDLLHYGERKTGLLDTFSLEEKAERLYAEPSTYLAWVTQTVKDVGRSIDFLVGVRGVDPDRIVYVGLSRGAVVGVIVGGAEKRLAGVVMSYGGHIGAWGVSGHRAAACPANYIGRIAPRPLLMMNGERDELFPKETTVLPLQALAREPSDFMWFDTGHTGMAQEGFAGMMEWLSENFGRR